MLFTLVAINMEACRAWGHGLLFIMGPVNVGSALGVQMPAGKTARGSGAAVLRTVSAVTRKMARTTSSRSPRHRSNRFAGWLVYLYVSMARPLCWL
jgi:hypothetical protein